MWDHKKRNRQLGLTIWTLLTHALIMIAAGHGLGNILLLELGFLANIVGFDDSFPLDGNWMVLVVVTILGQSLVIFTIFKQPLLYKTIKLIGLSFLTTAAVLLTVEAIEFGHEAITIISCIPFLVCASILIYRTINCNSVNDNCD